MKMNFLAVTVILFAAVLASANDAASGAIEFKREMFKLRNGAVLDTVDKSPVLKLVSRSDKGHPQGIVTLYLDPKVKYYELSCYVKTENIVSPNSSVNGADIIISL